MQAAAKLAFHRPRDQNASISTRNPGWQGALGKVRYGEGQMGGVLCNDHHEGKPTGFLVAQGSGRRHRVERGT
jgi:hypothetical protein